MDPKNLPIRRVQAELVAALKENDALVLIGETGSGKTTQLAQMILEESVVKEGQVIGVTQPRRVAAVTVARRVAEEMGVEIGKEVGYRVRFEDRTSACTKVKYLTDGTLLRETLDDPMLSKYGMIVLDEAHERSLNTDILFGVLKSLIKTRAGTPNPLKVVITSATLDGDRFAQYFYNCRVFSVSGRTFPVEVLHVDQTPRQYLDAALECAIDVHCHEPEGDILLFLTGQHEIDKAVRTLNDRVRNLPAGSCGDLLVMPLYAAMPPEMQARVFAPAPAHCRRCIVATNIAETSVTVNGVVYVIDPGMVKQKHYNARTAMDSLDVVAISRVQATQRAGRAGRTQPGKCFRLYTKKYMEQEMPQTTKPEIQRTSLVSGVLYLKSLPLDIDVLAFDFLDKPDRSQLEDALRQLYILGAIDQDGHITELGRLMSHLPLDPALARALIAALELDCVPEMLTVAAMLSAESIFMGGRGPEVSSGGPAGPSRPGQAQERQYSTDKGRAAMQRLVAEGLGDHVLMLRLYETWAQSNFDKKVAMDLGLDLRGMRFARDVRRQLVAMVGEGGERLDKLRRKEHEDAGKPDALPDQDPAADPDEELASAADVTLQSRGGSMADLTSAPPSKRQRTDEGPSGRDSDGSPQKREMYNGFSEKTGPLREALTTGFANKLARRMPQHNGYRTMVEGNSQLVQVHPNCAQLHVSEDGLYPDWIIYHELVNTGRPCVRQVCAIEAKCAERILPRLQQVDVQRLSGGATTAQAVEAAQRKEKAAREAAEKAAAAKASEGQAGAKKDDAAIDAARQRYLARKAAAAGPAAKKK